MPQRDITGKELYKEITFRSIKRDVGHYCFIALRTKLSFLDFFVDIFKRTDYLFKLSAHSLEIVLDSRSFIFKVFQYQDPLSGQLVVCFINKDISKAHYLLGEKTENACFTLLKSKNRNQLSFSFDDEIQEEQNYDEQKNWTLFKEIMQKKSVDLMGEIDFLFPVKIQTYEILKPLFLEFINMDVISLDGLVSGSARLSRVLDRPVFQADLSAKDFAFNKSRWGDLTLQSAWEREEKRDHKNQTNQRMARRFA